MSKPKLSQTVLYDILVQEVESLKKTRDKHQELLSGIDALLNHLQGLWQKPIPIDIEPMQQEHARIASTLQKGLYIPQWLGISFLCLVIAFSISISFNYRQYVKIKDQRELIEYAKLHIEELEKQIPKPKNKR